MCIFADSHKFIFIYICRFVYMQIHIHADSYMYVSAYFSFVLFADKGIVSQIVPSHDNPLFRNLLSVKLTESYTSPVSSDFHLPWQLLSI